MTAGVAGFIGVKCSRPSVAYTQEHQHTHTHKQMHREKKERKRRDRRQAANNRTKTKQKWLVNDDWRTVTDTVLKHTPTCQGVGILQMYWGFSSFISIFVTREKKKEKMLHPTLSILSTDKMSRERRLLKATDVW